MMKKQQYWGMVRSIPEQLKYNQRFWEKIQFLADNKEEILAQAAKEEQITLKRKQERVFIDLEDDDEEILHSFRCKKSRLTNQPSINREERNKYRSPFEDTKVSTTRFVESYPTSTEASELAADVSLSDSESERLRVAMNLARMRYYSREEGDEERRNGVSMRLKLYEDPWKLKIFITKDNLGKSQCRLVLEAGPVKEHMLKFLSEDVVKAVEKSSIGAQLNFWDVDTKSMHKLVLKKLAGTSYYGLIPWWGEYTVRRSLSVGDQIGFYWDTYHSRFNFCVLKHSHHPMNQ